MLKSILILFQPNDEGSAVLKVAINLTKKLKAHLNVIYAHRFTPSSLQDPHGEMRRFLDDQTYQSLLKKRDAHIDEEKIEAHDLFKRIIEELGIQEVENPSIETVPSVSWDHFNSNEHDALFAQGGLNDLIVLGYGSDSLEDFNRRTIELALFNSHRPVLIAPSKANGTAGENIMIGWNRSAQSCVALSTALPILQTAKNIEIFSIDTGAKQGPSVQEAVQYLAFRGVKSVLHEVPRTPPHVGEIILDRAKEINADLLVMGAYSHNRVREMILGGVTQHILDHAELPVMMVR